MKKKILFFDIIICLLIFILICILILTINLNVYNSLLKNKETIFENIKDNLGISIEYNGVKLTFFGVVTLSDVIITTDSDVRLSAGDVKLYFSLINYFINPKQPMSVIKKVSIKNINFTVTNLDSIKEFNSLLLKSKNKKEKFNLPKLSIFVTSGKITLIKDAIEVIFDIKKLKVVLFEKAHFYCDLVTYLNKNSNTIFSSKINSNGDFYVFKTFTASNFNLKLYNIFYKNIQIKDQSFLFKSLNDNFIIEREKDILPIDFSLMKFENDFSSSLKINKLESNRIFLTTGKTFYIPDLIDINFNLRFNKLESLFLSHLKAYIHYDTLLTLKNLDFVINTRFENNRLYFDKFKIINSDNSFINLIGNIPFYDTNFKVDLNFNNFNINDSIINTTFFIKKNNSSLNIYSEPIIINNENIGSFSYFIILKNNSFLIFTEKSFNGYTITGSGYKSNNGYNIKLEHLFNFFSVTKLLNPFKKQTDLLLLDGKIIQTIANNKNEIENSKIVLLKNNKKLYDFYVRQKEEIFYLDVNDNDKKIIRSWFNLRNQPTIISINCEILNNNFDIISKISSKSVKIDVNKQLLIEYPFNEKKIYFKSKDFLIHFTKSKSVYLNFDFIYNIPNSYIPESIVLLTNINMLSNKNGNLKFKLKMNSSNLNFYDIVYFDQSSFIKGDLLAKYDLDNKIFYVSGFLKDSNGDESYSINATLDKRNISSTFYLTNFDIKKLAISENISGRLNIRGRINGYILKPEATVQIELDRGKYNKKDLQFMIEVKKNNDTLKVNKGLFKIDNNFITLDKLEIIDDIGKNSFLGNGKLLLFGLGKNLRINYLISGDFFNNFENINLNLYFNKIQIGFLTKNDLVRYDMIDISPVMINFRKNKSNIEVYDKNKDIFVLNHNNHNFNLIVKDKGNNVLVSNFTYTNRDLKGELQFSDFPVNFINLFLLPYVGIEEGYTTGKLKVNIKNNSHDFYGRLNVYNGVVNLPQYLQDKIKNISGVIIAENKKFFVNGVNGEVRDGLAYGYGEIILSNTGFERYEFHINGDNIPGKLNVGPVDAIAIGSIEDLILQGQPGSYDFIGSLYLDTAYVNIKNVIGSSEEKKVVKRYPINVVMNFKSGKKVHINYPIMNALIKPDQILTVSYYGEEPATYISGKVALEKGTVNYLNKNFKIEDATFTFYENETNINPLVNLQAVYKTKDFNKNQVKLYLNINDRLFPLNVKFSSFPTKNQEEINSLLGLSYAYNTNFKNGENSISDSNNNKSNIETLVDTTNYLGSFFIFSPIESKIRRLTNLDTFSFNTKFLGNIVKSNLSLTTSTFELLDETSLTVGKYLFSQLYFESVLSLNKKKSVNDNLFLPFKNQNYGLNLQLMLQFELENLSIGYTFMPKRYTNFFDAEHKISLEANFKL